MTIQPRYTWEGAYALIAALSATDATHRLRSTSSTVDGEQRSKGSGATTSARVSMTTPQGGVARTGYKQNAQESGGMIACEMHTCTTSHNGRRRSTGGATAGMRLNGVLGSTTGEHNNSAQISSKT